MKIMLFTIFTDQSYYIKYTLSTIGLSWDVKKINSKLLNGYYFEKEELFSNES